MLGLILILFATKNLSQDLKGRLTIYLFMLVIVLSLTSGFLFYITSVILLLVIAEHYFVRTLKKKNNMSLYLLIAMILLLFGIVRFFFIIPYFCMIQPMLFFISFLIVGIVVIKSYKQ
jgi:hypothetical protein